MNAKPNAEGQVPLGAINASQFPIGGTYGRGCAASMPRQPLGHVVRHRREQEKMAEGALWWQNLSSPQAKCSCQQPQLQPAVAGVPRDLPVSRVCHPRAAGVSQAARPLQLPIFSVCWCLRRWRAEKQLENRAAEVRKSKTYCKASQKESKRGKRVLKESNSWSWPLYRKKWLVLHT